MSQLSFIIERWGRKAVLNTVELPNSPLGVVWLFCEIGIEWYGFLTDSHHTQLFPTQGIDQHCTTRIVSSDASIHHDREWQIQGNYSDSDVSCVLLYKYILVFTYT